MVGNSRGNTVMDPDVRRALDKIDDVIHELYEKDYGSYGNLNKAELLAQILRAMRGPDNQNGSMKAATTAIIRKVAFPKSGGRFGDISYDRATVMKQDLDYKLDRAGMRPMSVHPIRVFGSVHGDVDEHFMWAVINAANALCIIDDGKPALTPLDDDKSNFVSEKTGKPEEF